MNLLVVFIQLTFRLEQLFAPHTKFPLVTRALFVVLREGHLTDKRPGATTAIGMF